MLADHDIVMTSTETPEWQLNNRHSLAQQRHGTTSYSPPGFCMRAYAASGAEEGLIDSYDVVIGKSPVC